MTEDEEDRAAIAAIWARSQTRLLGRVGVVEGAVAALAARALDDAQRSEATTEAHKLAGSLGTFGLPEGTEIARGIEHALSRPDADAAVLTTAVARLRTLVQAGPP